MDNLTTTKRIIYISIGVIILGLLIYTFYPSAKPSAPGAETQVGKYVGKLGGENRQSSGNTGGISATEETQNQTITGVEEKLTRITNFPVVSPSLNKAEDGILFYKKDGGDLISYNIADKKQEKVSNITILGLEDVYWSPTRDRAAVFYIDQENKKGFIQTGTSSVSILLSNIKSFSWSPDGKSTAFLVLSSSGLDVVVADAFGKNSKIIFSTPILDAGIKWVSADKIILETPPSGLAEGFVFSLSRSGGALKKIIGPFRGLATTWSPDGSSVLVGRSEEGGANYSSFIGDSSGKEVFKVNIPVLREKCFWMSVVQVFCAVPQNIPSNMAFPDDYLTGEFNPSDNLVLIDTLSKSFYGVLGNAGFDMSNLQVTKDGKYLFFVNRKDGTLWQLQLK